MLSKLQAFREQESTQKEVKVRRSVKSELPSENSEQVEQLRLQIDQMRQGYLLNKMPESSDMCAAARVMLVKERFLDAVR